MSDASSQKIILAQYALFLFDFDGLLVDSERLHFRAYQELCSSYNLELPWDFATFCHFAHRSSDHLRNGIFAALPALAALGISWDELYKRKKAYYHQDLARNGVSLMPGVEAFLHYLQHLGKSCCVVTNSPLQDVAFIREQHEVLRAIPHWLTREDYDQPKPAADGYRLALKRYLQVGGKAIGFEDSPRGITALRQTEALPVFVANFEYSYFGERERAGVICCQSLSDLLV